MIQKYTTTSKNNTIKNVLLVALLFVSTITFAQPGSLDPTFNTFDDGTRGDGSGFNGAVYSTAIQADGKIIVGGDFWSFSGTFGINGIVRLNANGTLDTTFNAGTGFNKRVNSITIQADGKIIVGGEFTSFNETTGINYIVRLNTNGTRDTSFNTGTGFNGIVNSISIHEDGKVILGGGFSTFDGTNGINYIVRLNANGTLDTTFNSGTVFNDRVFSTSIQADGKIIVGGNFSSFNGTNKTNYIARLNTNGVLDTTFNSGTGFDNTVWTTFIQMDGKIIVGGSFSTFNSTTGINRIVRLNANGMRDLTFNPGTDFNSSVYSISVQSDGKMIIGGNFSSFNGITDKNYIVRLNTNGIRDNTFNIGAGFNNSVYSTSVQVDGKIIVVGGFSSFNGKTGINSIIRLNTNGIQDTTFNVSAGFDNTVRTTFVQADGKIIVGGDFSSFNGTIGLNRIVRLNANGTRDTTFNTGTGFDNTVRTTFIQADGKIIVGGDFSSFSGTIGLNRIIRLNANGTRDTTFNIGTGFDNPVKTISMQADGKIIVGGLFTSFNGTTGINYIVRLNTNGMRDTSFKIGAGFNNSVYSTSIQADGKIIVGGHFTSFNGTNGINRIVRLNTNGTRDTTFNTGTGFYKAWFMTTPFINSTTIQPDGKIIVGGRFDSFDDTTGIYNIVRLHTNGKRDTTFKTGTAFNDFLNVFRRVESTFVQPDGKIIVGGSFSTFNGTTGIKNIVRLHANGTLDATFNAGKGFGSEVYSISNQADGKIIVGGYFTSFNGKRKNRLIRLLGGCIPTTSPQNVVACDNYTWLVNGTTYNSSGTYSAQNCDSTVTLNLTIIKPTIDTQNVAACNSYNWLANNTTYTNSGTYTTKLTNSNGCDSTIILNLTINKPTSNTQNVAACNSYKWLANDTTYTNSGTYTAKLTSSAGCDSTIMLNLTINKSTIDTQNATACDTYTWLANGNTYTNSGTYTAKLNNAAGCDSTITLNLTIKPKPVLTTSVSGATITASETSASYQWIDCNKGNTPIAGAVNKSFTATANGSYAVIVTKNTCSGTSTCVNITNVGISPIASQSEQILIFPNPNNGAFTISAESEGVYTIQNSLGQIIQSVTLNAANNYSMNIENLSNGIYFVAGYNNNMITQQKVLVTK